MFKNIQNPSHKYLSIKNETKKVKIKPKKKLKMDFFLLKTVPWGTLIAVVNEWSKLLFWLQKIHANKLLEILHK